MLTDFMNWPDQGVGDVQQFLPLNAAGGSTPSWHTWRKPRGCSFVFLFGVSGGAGGGFGFTRTAGNPGGGGGGGGPGAAVATMIPALFLPDILYVAVGFGGTPGNSGNETLISVQPNNSTNGFFILNITGGGFGGIGSAGAAGSGGGVGASTTARLGTFGPLVTGAGPVGASGGAQTGAVGANVAYLAGTNGFVCGGAGGAGSTGTDFAGGNQTSPSTAYYPTINGGSGAGAAGAPGIKLPDQFIFTGGSGGASNNSGVGGAGGAGALGCGGGGGGAGATGGAGGRGGDGIVIIASI